MVATPLTVSSESKEERVALYKEERRRELAARYGPRDPPTSVRSTRASRLRTQAARQDASKVDPIPLSTQLVSRVTAATATASPPPTPRSHQPVQSPVNSTVSATSRNSSAKIETAPSPRLSLDGWNRTRRQTTPPGILKVQTGSTASPSPTPILRRHSHAQSSAVTAKGILKKHHSLDDPAPTLPRPEDTETIVIGIRRRGSLDTNQSQPQSILKRKSLTPKSESFENPPGILKQSTVTNSVGVVGDSPSQNSGMECVAPSILKTRWGSTDNSERSVLSSSPPRPKPILKNSFRNSLPVTDMRPAKTESEHDSDSDIEPSQLTLAERVRLFSGGSAVRSSIRRSATTPAVLTVKLNRRSDSSISESDSSDASSFARSPSPPKHMFRRSASPLAAEEVDGTALTGGSIAARVAALRANGAEGWRSRVGTREGGPGTPLSARLGQLETAAAGWKARVPSSDAPPPSRLPPQPVDHRPPPSPANGNNPAHRAALNNALQSAIRRSASANFIPSTNHAHTNHSNSASPKSTTEAVVHVPVIADNSFHSFFPSLAPSIEDGTNDVDLHSISESTSSLLVNKRRVKARRKHVGSANPLKVLAKRSDLATEYTEKRTFKAYNNRGYTAEALAGLASVEDTSRVVLKKAEPVAQVTQWSLPLLIRIKGRRHPIVHLVPSPSWTVIDRGDAFVLVTSQQIFCWQGDQANVMERSLASEVAADIARRRDMGSGGGPVVSLAGGCLPSDSGDHTCFWSTLGLPDDRKDHMGHDEDAERGVSSDEVFESWMSSCYRIFHVEEGELVCIHQDCPRPPRASILLPDQVMVFDAVTEIYCWNGKYSTQSVRRQGRSLATRLPRRDLPSSGIPSIEKEMVSRPEPSIYSIVQNMEPAIFREKFADWPATPMTPATKASAPVFDKGIPGSPSTMRPCDVLSMVDWVPPQVDLVLEGSHLGRGTTYYDPEIRRQYAVSTIDVKTWTLVDGSIAEMDPSPVYRLQDNRCYIFKWSYRLTITGRELGGGISRHGAVGRDRCALITWQGARSGLEGGTAALLARGIDRGAPHTTITQGNEPPALLAALGPDSIVVLDRAAESEKRLYLIEIGQSSAECSVLREVDCSASSLRRGLSFLCGKHLWHGSGVESSAKSKAHLAAQAVVGKVEEETQGKESEEFKEAIGIEGELNPSSSTVQAVFELCPVKGEYTGVPLVPVRFNPEPENTYPYRYNQEEIYATSDGCTLLIDSGEGGVWLWCRSGSPYSAALKAAGDYASAKRLSPPKLVVPHAEPDEFTHLFPYWNRDPVGQPPDGWTLGESRLCSDEVDCKRTRTPSSDDSS